MVRVRFFAPKPARCKGCRDQDGVRESASLAWINSARRGHDNQSKSSGLTAHPVSTLTAHRLCGRRTLASPADSCADLIVDSSERINPGPARRT